MQRLFVYFILLLGCQAQAQSIKELLATGDQFYSKKKYSNALEAYQQAYAINPDDALVNFKIGLAYLYSDTKSKAATYIDKAHRLNASVNPDIDYYLGIAFQNTNNFKKAIEHFKDFKKKNDRLSAIADEKIDQCIVADSLAENELNVIIENLGKSVNSSFDEHSPIISADGNTLIFTSNRPDNNTTSKVGNLEDVYIVTKTGKEWGTPKKISTHINTPKYNDAAASLSPDGKTLFLYSEEGAGDIYISRFEGNDWTDPKPLGRNINTSQYWETCASISADGKKLYFTSDRPGGYGELDIYLSELDAKGEWGKAVNLGPVINTPSNEDSPSIHYDGKTLYFSSNGHRNLGNNDIFMSEFKNGKWQKPENIGFPINSWEYDGFFTISPDKKKAYYSTVKDGGLGGIDIYSISFLEPKYKPKPLPPVVKKEEPKPVKKEQPVVHPIVQKSIDLKVVTVLRGKVIDETTASPLGASISLIDNLTNTILTKINADATTGDFEIIIPHGGNYGVATEKDGYLFNSINFNLPQFAEYQEIDTHIIMVKAEIGSKVVLRNIFFDVGKFDLKQESIAEVEKIRSLLIGNASLKVQINGHTDNTGNAIANKTLSLKRASAVVEYLTQHGIGANRLYAKGYGSERPIVSNDDETGGREINRRTEIEIIDAETQK